MTEPDVMVGWCMDSKGVAPEFLMSMLHTVTHPRVAEVKAFRSGPIIDMTRNLIVGRFLKSDCKRLLMVDTDMSWTAEQLGALIAHGDAGYDVISGWYNRQVDLDNFYEETPVCGSPADMGLRNATKTGCGFLLVHRTVFKHMPPPYFKVEWDGEFVVGEDVYFCRKAIEAGYPVVVDTDMHIGHVKPVVI